MRTPRPSATAAAAIILAVLLSGCTVRIIDPAAESPGATSGSTDTETPAAETPAAERPPTKTPEATEHDGLDAEHAEHRQRLLDSVTTTMPCPTGPLQQDGSIIRIEGACAEVRIDLDAGAVIVDDVTTILLSGSGTVIYAGTLGEVRVSGSANEIYWTGETPQVTDTGTANVLRRG
ncbi:DUF3060 domain-containing protein [Microbacterium sp. EST19A]|uniref:DUF3060 domain-containing protein n=1 Tax=Microbacterium sp. EST19A TaxID=2862681 RepID=UPI001CBE609D|nr:DUF3060 domain-containing protein [Microbacterium sp. EST19A]